MRPRAHSCFRRDFSAIVKLSPLWETPTGGEPFRQRLAAARSRAGGWARTALNPSAGRERERERGREREREREKGGLDQGPIRVTGLSLQCHTDQDTDSGVARERRVLGTRPRTQTPCKQASKNGFRLEGLPRSCGAAFRNMHGCISFAHGEKTEFRCSGLLQIRSASTRSRLPAKWQLACDITTLDTTRWVRLLVVLHLSFAAFFSSIAFCSIPLAAAGCLPMLSAICFEFRSNRES